MRKNTMIEHPSNPYASIWATSEIVDRQDLLDQVHAALADPSDVTYVFYIMAPGGWGKTRLVEEILYRLQPVRPVGPANMPRTGEWYSPDILAARSPVDLYHMSAHSEEGMIHEIYQTLAPAIAESGRNLFAKYIEASQKLEEVKYDLAEILREVNQQRKKVVQAFIEDFNGLHPPYRRTVLALDTAETMVYETDRVQRVLGLADEPTGVAAWLLREFLPRVKNAIILLAGRPENSRLAEALEKTPNIHLIRYELQPFNEAESLRFFGILSQAARTSGDEETARRIESIPEETRRILHLYSGGQPLLLSLMLDYLAVTDELIPEVNVSFDEARQRTSSPQGRLDVQDEIKTAIVRHLLETRRPADDVIRMLALTPKGMEPELLAQLRTLGPSIAPAEIEDAQKRLDGLKKPRLSFIKVRPDDTRVFLHDEMYEMLKPAVYDSLSPGVRGRIEQIIDDYTTAKVKEARKRAQEVGAAEWVPDVRLTRTSGQLVASRPAVSPEELFRVRLELQMRQIDQVFYALRRNVAEGYELYYRYAEDAYIANDDSMRWLLRDLILRFKDTWVKQISMFGKTAGPSEADIERDLGLGWIKPNVAQGKHEATLKLIAKFRENCADLVQDPATAAEIDVWEGWAEIHVSKDLEYAVRLLQNAVEQLESVINTSAKSPHYRYLLGEAFTYLAYGYRTQGRFRDAIQEYNKALVIWRELNYPAEHANTLNNLAWAEAETGDVSGAIQHCNDALRIRRWLGRRYTVALSLNTLGLILTRNGQPDRANGYCVQAWDIFRDLGQPRGVGLASIAVAESLRRMIALPYLFTPEQAMEKLLIAEQRAREAVHIFETEILEPMRLVEALNELGCTIREIVRLGRRYKLIDAGECERMTHEAEDTLRRASQEASGRFVYRQVEALVNLAWLRYYVDDLEGARHILHGSGSEVLTVIPQEHLIIRGQGISQTNNPVMWFWVQLGKANLLLGQIEFDNYKALNRTLRGKGIDPEDREEAWDPLKEAGRLFTLSEAYNGRYLHYLQVAKDRLSDAYAGGYGESFYYLQAGEDRLYELLAGLNVHEMDVVRVSIAQTNEEYKLPGELRLMQRFMDKRFGQA
jgi:tetratricopeptide (TPR) repeat protein